MSKRYESGEQCRTYPESEKLRVEDPTGKDTVMASALKNKGFKSLDAGKYKIQPGGSGKMQTFKAAGDQKPGVTSVSSSGGGKSFGDKLKTGGSGKMQKFTGTGPQKSGRTSQR